MFPNTKPFSTYYDAKQVEISQEKISVNGFCFELPAYQSKVICPQELLEN